MSHTFREQTEWDFDDKKSKRDKRKAKEKEALKLGKEIIPEFPKTDVWEWN
jgi:hypothetical protein